MADRRIILTGAPGTGKTAVLAALDSAIQRHAEPARELLAEEPGIDQRPDDFLAGLLARSIEKWEASAGAPGPVVYDRGVPDCGAYARYSGVDGTAADRAAAAYRYHPEVLLLEPWEEIYTTDAERTMTYDMTVRFHGCVLRAYGDTGYELVAVPRAPIAERAAFVADFAART